MRYSIRIDLLVRWCWVLLIAASIGGCTTVLTPPHQSAANESSQRCVPAMTKRARIAPAAENQTLVKPTPEALSKFSADALAFMPKVFGEAITNNTAKTAIGGWLQGATLRAGKGRVAVFGEAAMFSAQLAGPNKTPMGMNAPNAKQNPQFLLNVLHWLSGLLDK